MGDTYSTPRVVPIRLISGTRGSAIVDYCSRLPPPDVALASAYGPTPQFFLSRTVKVLIPPRMTVLHISMGTARVGDGIPACASVSECRPTASFS
jgi:hypothetical protein